ncbi:uncharacterized protein WCC33_012843 isoform 1-T1 [Rhinophrynus dorsalis]
MKSVVYLMFVSGLCILNTQGAHSAIKISGPQYPVLEGDDVTLECISDNDSDMNHITFQKYSSWVKKWFALDSKHYFRCWYYNINVSREDGRLLLKLSDISSWQAGPYRCVSSGNWSQDAVESENITISVYYLRDICLQRARSWSPSVSDVLLVEEGSDVEIKCSASASQEPLYEWSQESSDWILPSDTLILKNVVQDNSGAYTCQARHPDMYDLVKTKTFQLHVIPKPRESQLFYGGLGVGDILLYIAAPAMTLLFLLMTLFVLIMRHRKRQLRKPQISLVDGEKRIPIYKGSAQSIHSSTSDTQPLVM